MSRMIQITNIIVVKRIHVVNWYATQKLRFTTLRSFTDHFFMSSATRVLRKPPTASLMRPSVSRLARAVCCIGLHKGVDRAQALAQ